jgi:hypothetical protein
MKTYLLCVALALTVLLVAGTAYADLTYTDADMVGWTWDYYDTVEPIGASYDNTTKAGWLTIHLPEDNEAPPSNQFDGNPILYRTGLGIPDSETTYDVLMHVDFVNGGGRAAGLMVFAERNWKIQMAEQDGTWLTFHVYWNGGNQHVFGAYSGEERVDNDDYFKLHVEGNVITMFSSADGSAWTQRGSPLDMTGTWFDTATNSTLKLGVTDMTWDTWNANRDAHFEHITISWCIPEPSVTLALGTGLLALAAAMRKRK